MGSGADRRAEQRLDVLRGLSGLTDPICACCDEHRLWSLTIDHLHGGGVQHRRERGHTTTWRLVWREYREHPDWDVLRTRYQVLCATCNHGRRVSPTGDCPHRAEQVLV